MDFLTKNKEICFVAAIITGFVIKKCLETKQENASDHSGSGGNYNDPSDETDVALEYNIIDENEIGKPSVEIDLSILSE